MMSVVHLNIDTTHDEMEILMRTRFKGDRGRRAYMAEHIDG